MDCGALGVKLNRFLALLPALFVASATLAATGLTNGGLSQFQVELPSELRQLAGRGHLSPVMHALVTIAVPENFDTARDWPVMVISATSDPQYNSSRHLLGAYADAAIRRMDIGGCRPCRERSH